MRLYKPRHGPRRSPECGIGASVSGRGLTARAPAVFGTTERRREAMPNEQAFRRSAATALRGRGATSAAGP
jgi:hypothetical protein